MADFNRDTMTLHLTILYFGPAREKVGIGREEFSLEDSLTVAELREKLLERHSSLREIMSQSRIAFQEEYVQDGYRIERSGEVALIPPVAGG